MSKEFRSMAVLVLVPILGLFAERTFFVEDLLCAGGLRDETFVWYVCVWLQLKWKEEMRRSDKTAQRRGLDVDVDVDDDGGVNYLVIDSLRSADGGGGSSPNPSDE